MFIMYHDSKCTMESKCCGYVIEKTQEVIKKHMETVQQVACLLGENAAFTDATLRTVMEAYKKNDQKKPL